MQKKNIIVVGAGPVGALWGSYLAQQGHRVRIFESRTDMRLDTLDVGRSINLALSNRGFKALQLIGIEDQVRTRGIAMEGRRIHINGEVETSLQAYGLEGEAIYSVSRGGLNAHLMDYAEKHENLEIIFDQKVTAVDFKTSEIELLAKSGESCVEKADFIFAADGMFSAVRRSMMRQERYDYSQEWLTHGYKELHIPCKADGGYRLEPNALHIWPRGTFMLIALPNLDGSFTCTLFLPFKGQDEDDTFCFDRLDSPKAIEAFFDDVFSDVVPLMPDLVNDFATNPTASLGVIRCSPWHMNRSCLLGDAAHAIVPFYGQGLNAGLEDCSVLAELLEQTDGSNKEWKKALEQYTQQHKKNGDAIADLALYNFIEMRDRVIDPQFVLQKKIEKKIQLNYSSYLPLYSMVTFSHTPYHKAQEYGKAQELLMQSILEIDNIEDFEDSSEIWGQVEKKVEMFLRERE